MEPVSKYIQRNIQWLIGAALFIAASITFELSIALASSHPILSSLLTNLASGFFISMVTILGIEEISKRLEHARRAKIRHSAKDDITELSRMNVSYSTAPFGITVYDFPQQTGESNEEWTQRSLAASLDALDLATLKQKLPILTKEDLGHLGMNLQMVSTTFSENLQLYVTVLNPEILGRALMTKRAFGKIFSFYPIFVAMSQIPTIDPRTDPDGAASQRANRTAILNGFANALNQYFSEVNQFMALVNNSQSWQ